MPANPAKALFSPDNHSLLMIDHQYLQMLTIRSTTRARSSTMQWP